MGLKNRAIKAEEDDEPVIKEIDSRSHDPFPLVSREDGKVVNPLNQTADQSIKEELVSKVTSSSSPDSSHVDSAAVLCVSEDSALPDSTSNEPDSSSIGMIRTNTGTTSRSSDTGYNTISSTGCVSEGSSMLSPNSDVFEASSHSSISPSSDVVANPQGKSSWKNPSSVYTSGSLGSVSVATTETACAISKPSNDHISIASNNSIASDHFHNSAISSSAAKPHPQSRLATNSTPPALISSQTVPLHTNQPLQQSPNLSSLLTSDSPQGYSVTPNAPQVSAGHQQSDTTRSLGKRNAVGISYIKQETTMQQGYPPYNVQPNQYASFPQTGSIYQQQQQTNGSYTNNVPPPPLQYMGPQNYPVSASQSNVLPQEYQQYFTPSPASSNNPVFQSQNFLPEWENQSVKSEFPNFGPPVTYQQVPPSNGQSVSHFPQRSSNHHPTNVQNSFNTVSNQQLPSMTVNMPPYGGQDVEDQLPLLTGEDMRVLDDIGNYAANTQQYF